MVFNRFLLKFSRAIDNGLKLANILNNIENMLRVHPNFTCILTISELKTSKIRHPCITNRRQHKRLAQTQKLSVLDSGNTGIYHEIKSEILQVSFQNSVRFHVLFDEITLNYPFSLIS